MHETYRNFYLARAQAAIAAARAATDITHRGVKGEIREILVRDLFRPLLPADVGIGSGHVISHTGKNSSQLDIIIYDRRILPPILFEERLGLFPVEAVLYVIEIKSKLTMTELKTSDAAARQILNLEIAAGRFNELGQDVQHIVTKPVYTLFAFDTDLVDGGKGEDERYRDLLAIDQALPAIRSICVVGRNTWYCRDPANWMSRTITFPLEEVLVFIFGIMNTYKDIALSRLSPRLGRYIFD